MDLKPSCSKSDTVYYEDGRDETYNYGTEYVELDPIELWMESDRPKAKVRKERGRPRKAQVVNLLRSVKPEVIVIDDESYMDTPGNDGQLKCDGVARVFVAPVGESMMHCEWPLYNQNPMHLNTIVKLFAASVINIPQNQICLSIPQEYTHAGSFIVYYGDLDQDTDLADDGLGVWTQVETIQRNYIERENTFQEADTDYPDLRITCHQFLHQGTDESGDFIKRIYTGTYKDAPKSPYIVINYEWMGAPHPVAISNPPLLPEEPTRITKAESKSFVVDENGSRVPVLRRRESNFDQAAKILLSATKLNGFATSCPQNVASIQQMTLVYNLDTIDDIDQFVYRDGHAWNVVESAEKVYSIQKLDCGENVVIRRSSRQKPAKFEAKIQCKVLSGPADQPNADLIKKIYLVYGTVPLEVDLPNKNILMVSYEKNEEEIPSPEELQEIAELTAKIERKADESRQRIVTLMCRSEKLISEAPWHHQTPQIRELDVLLSELKKELV